MAETRPIPDVAGYFVSDDGRVFSEKSGTRREMRQSQQHGYKRVTLRINGSTVYKYVHVLVATVFIGPCPGQGYEVLHGDGTRDNNAVDNLSWGTRSDNMMDAVRHGRNPQHLYPERATRGTRVHGAKLNDAAVAQIRGRAANGETANALAAEFRVSRDAIRLAVRGVTWRHVA